MFGLDWWMLALTIALLVIAALYIHATEPRPKPPVSKPAEGAVSASEAGTYQAALNRYENRKIRARSSCDRLGHLSSALGPFCVDCGERIRPNDPDEAA